MFDFELFLVIVIQKLHCCQMFPVGLRLKFECCVIKKSHLNAQRTGSTQCEITEQPFKLCMFALWNINKFSVTFPRTYIKCRFCLHTSFRTHCSIYCMFFILMLLINGYHVLKLEIRLRWGLEGWLSGYKSLLLLQKTRVCFLAPTWWLVTVCIQCQGMPFLLRPPRAPAHTPGAHILRHTYLHIKLNR